MRGCAARGFYALNALFQTANLLVPLARPRTGEVHKFIVAVRQIQIQAHRMGQVQIQRAAVDKPRAAGNRSIIGKQSIPQLQLRADDGIPQHNREGLCLLVMLCVRGRKSGKCRLSRGNRVGYIREVCNSAAIRLHDFQCRMTKIRGAI